MTVVLVGKAELGVVVPTRLLTATSAYFKKEVEQVSKSSSRKMVKVSETVVNAFILYVAWLYTKTLYTGENDEESTMPNPSEQDKGEVSNLVVANNSEGEDTSTHNIEFSRLLQCVLLANTIEDNVFHNAVVDCIIDRAVELSKTPTGYASDFFTKLPQASPARRLIVDFWVYAGDPSWYARSEALQAADVNAGPREFWAAVALGFTKKGTNSEIPWLEDRCQYHIHPEGEPKCA